MERVGEVTAAKGGWLEITFCRQTDCGECHACMGTKKETTVRVRGNAAVGDAALVEMPTATVMKASAMAYVIPLAGLLGGLFLGGALAPASQDVGALLGALAGLLLSLGVMALTERHRQKDPAWTPILREIYPRKAGMPKMEGDKKDGK